MSCERLLGDDEEEERVEARQEADLAQNRPGPPLDGRGLLEAPAPDSAENSVPHLRGVTHP